MAALSAVTDTLTRLAGMIRAETNEVVATGDPIPIIRHFDALRRSGELIKTCREALKEMEDHLSAVAIPDAMRAKEIKTITIEGFGRCTVSYKFSASILEGQKLVAFDWLRENGHGDLIQETVNSSTLAAFAKDMIQNEGKELPDAIFKVGTNPYTSITKVK